MENNKDINKIIGKNLLALRKDKKLTQVELAEMFNYSDKSISNGKQANHFLALKFYMNYLNFMARRLIV